MDINSYYNLGYTNGIAEALAGTNIEYSYHHHIGSQNSGTGCYSKAVYHTHSIECTKNVVCTGTYSIYVGSAADIWDMDDGGTVYACNVCGCQSNAAEGSPCTQVSTKIACGKTENTITRYDLGCGKTEDTIESATILFNNN